MNEHLKNQKLLTICILFFILFNFPILGLVNIDQLVLGVPLLLLYLMSVWILFIVIIALTVTKDSLKENNTEIND